MGLNTLTMITAHAIKTCPGGPTVPVKVGRVDSSVAAPLGILPAANANSDDLIALFASKGFSATDLVALVGSHTAAKQKSTVPASAGAALDSTPGEWDTSFYQETLDSDAPFTIQADKSLSENTGASGEWKRFANSQAQWSAAFVPAMVKMSMLGVDQTNLIDCTGALPGGSARRDVRRAPVFDRI